MVHPLGEMLLQQLRVNTQNHNILVIIKKGDPIHRLSFIYPNLDDGIILKEEKDPEKIEKINQSYEEGRLRIMEENPLWKRRLFSKTNSKSKCHVGFLFK